MGRVLAVPDRPEHFKLRDFDKSCTLLEVLGKEYPEGKYAGHVRVYLGRTDPDWDVEQDGIATYDGKFAEDVRFQAQRNALPKHLEDGCVLLEERLGVDLRDKGRVEFRFEDLPPGSSSGLKGQARMIARDGEAVSYVHLTTERCLVDDEGFRRTAIHELGCRSTFLDDAQFWLGASLNYEGRGTEARQAFAVLLRDYPGSLHGKQFRGKLEPAGPVTE